MTHEDSRPWFQRNWKWLVPTGCLGLVVITVAWAAFITFFILAGTKTSGAYQDALATAVASPEARAVLGEPIEAGWWLMGSIDISGPSGKADIVFPISGPKGSAKLYVIGEKRAGQWMLNLLELEVEGRDARIDLLPGD